MMSAIQSFARTFIELMLMLTRVFKTVDRGVQMLDTVVSDAQIRQADESAADLLDHAVRIQEEASARIVERRQRIAAFKAQSAQYAADYDVVHAEVGAAIEKRRTELKSKAA